MKPKFFHGNQIIKGIWTDFASLKEYKMGLKRYFEMRAVATFYQVMLVIVVVVAYLIYTNFIQQDSPPTSKDNIEAEQPINQ